MRKLAALSAVLAAFAVTLSTNGTASATPTVFQEHAGCKYGVESVSISGVGKGGFAPQWLIKVGRTDNNQTPPCHWDSVVFHQTETTSQSGVPAQGLTQRDQSGSSVNGDWVLTAGGDRNIRPVRVGLRLCIDGQGCTKYAYQSVG